MDVFVDEIFSSFQGEGIYVGVPQLFIRFSMCHLRCYYCDSPDTWTKRKTARIEKSPYSGDYFEVNNPLAEDYLTGTIDRAIESSFVRYHSISFTGGEPLLQYGALQNICRHIRERRNILTYLESSGTLPHLLEKVVGYFDILSLDIKPPSCKGVKTDWNEIEKCVFLCRDSNFFAKIVLTNSSPTDEENEQIIKLVNRYNFQLIFTPVSNVNEETDPALPARINYVRNKYLDAGISISIVPQIHRIAGWD